MRLYIACLAINLVFCKKKFDYYSDETSEFKSGEELKDISDIETILSLKGNIRKLFAVELGLGAQGENMICSPMSALMPLAKLLLGANKKSKSHDELLAAVGLNNEHELNSTYRKIINELEFLEGVELSLASRMFLSNKLELQETFKNKSISIFRSTVELIDTSNPEEVADRVNQWVAKHTNDMITNLISDNDIDEGASLILVNAIYFKGSWREPFPAAIKKSFHSPTGSVKVPMMSKRGKFNYCRSDELNAQILELPYRGEEAAMIIILPYERKGLPILLQTLRLSQDLLTNALKEMVTLTVDVTIPRFKIESTIDLKSYFQKMHINNSLDVMRSDLTKVVKHQTVYISSAIQKAIIEVTEEGTVAAAASVLQIHEKNSLREEFKAYWPFLFYIRSFKEQLFAGVTLEALSFQLNHVKFEANHPFLFYIRANHEQLFGGVVNAP